MHCHKCGTEAAVGSVFCAQCGARILDEVGPGGPSEAGEGPSGEISLDERNRLLKQVVAQKCLGGYFVAFSDEATATAILNRPGKKGDFSKWGVASLFMSRRERRVKISVDAAGRVLEEQSTG